MHRNVHSILAGRIILNIRHAASRRDLRGLPLSSIMYGELDIAKLTDSPPQHQVTEEETEVEQFAMYDLSKSVRQIYES